MRSTVCSLDLSSSVLSSRPSGVVFFFFSSRRRHTRFDCDWSSDVCSSDLAGTPLKQTDALVRELQLAQGNGEGVASLYGVSGSGTRLDASPTESGENIGKLTVVMEGGGNARTEAEITERLRDTMGQHPGAQVDFARPALFSFSTPLEIEIGRASC